MTASRDRFGDHGDHNSIPERTDRTQYVVKQATKVRTARRLLILASACGFAALWVGCSIQKHYQLLSFFFDGVPDPRIIAAGADSVRIAKETGGVYYIHEPYAQQRCTDCHTDAATGQILPQVEHTVCMKCHSGVQSQYTFTHGPVAANACVWCHAPHESTVKPLMRTTSPQVCQQCHGPALMGNPKSPVHDDLSRDCLECHFGHGGNARFYLRPNWAAERGDEESVSLQPAPEVQR